MHGAFLTCSLALLAMAAPAEAATTVQVGDGFPGGPIHPAVLITDQTGEVNELAISYEYDAPPVPGDGVVTVRDDAASLEAGEGCIAEDGAVRCEVEDLQVIRALLGDGDDNAVAESPPRGTRSCVCVSIDGGDGDDTLTSRDGATLTGDAGDDHLIGEPSVAGAPGGARLRSGEMMSGGAGNDRLEGGVGADAMSGGSFGEAPPPGQDHLDGGPGDDSLSDGDHAAGEIGPDTVIGGTDEDVIHSYSERTSAVTVDLSTRGGDGEDGENDDVFNVEVVYGGLRNDRLIGDGDANIFFPLSGGNVVFGGRGDDSLMMAFPTGRNVVNGGRGDDFIEVEAYDSGTVRCGPGQDRIGERQRGSNADRRVDDDQDLGPFIAAACEALTAGPWAIDPVPDEPPSGRVMHFDRLPDARFGSDFYMDLTTVGEPPFEHLDRAVLKRSGARLRLPAAIDRNARRNGFQFRAAAWDNRSGGPKVSLLWRFRQRRYD